MQEHEQLLDPSLVDWPGHCERRVLVEQRLDVGDANLAQDADVVRGVSDGAERRLEVVVTHAGQLLLSVVGG